MPFKNTEEEKAQKQAEQEARAYAASAVGRAAAAHERGDAFFQVEIDLSPGGGGLVHMLSSALAMVLPNRAQKAGKPAESTDGLGDIERIGWHLVHAGYVYVPTSSSSSRGSEGHSTTYDGKTVGIYLFRRVD